MVRAEMVYPLEPLSAPHRKGSRAPSQRELDASPAAALFLERAAAVTRLPASDETQRKAIAEICDRLDGLPLALELAASRTQMLSVEQIAQRLETRFRLPRGTAADVDPRQRTLRATIEWSYGLLEAEDRRMLLPLCDFRGRLLRSMRPWRCSKRRMSLSSSIELRACGANRFYPVYGAWRAALYDA